MKDKKTETTKEKSKTTKKHGSPSKVVKPSTDKKLEQLDQKWSERFSRLEAMLLLKVFTQPEPVFSSQLSYLQPILHQPVLLTTLSPSLSLNQLTDHHSPENNQPASHSSSAACSPALV